MAPVVTMSVSDDELPKDKCWGGNDSWETFIDEEGEQQQSIVMESKMINLRKKEKRIARNRMAVAREARMRVVQEERRVKAFEELVSPVGYADCLAERV